MQSTEDEDFNKFWKEIGSKVDGKFALAVAAWDASKNAFSKPVTPVKINSQQTTGDFTIGTREAILTYEGVEYMESDEYDSKFHCSRCEFEYDNLACSHVVKITQGHCLNKGIIWVENAWKEKV